MNHLIIIKGNAYREIKRSLQEMHQTNLYAWGLKENFDVELYKLENNLLAIRANEQLSVEAFAAFLHYLDNPEYRKHKAEIKGYITGVNSKAFRDKKLMMYVLQNDTDYGVLYAVTDTDENYRIDCKWKIIYGKQKPLRVIERGVLDFWVDFTSQISPVDSKKATYEYPEISLISQPEIIPIVHFRALTGFEKIIGATKTIILVMFLLICLFYLLFMWFL
jgi:hypothetical protein